MRGCEGTKPRSRRSERRCGSDSDSVKGNTPAVRPFLLSTVIATQITCLHIRVPVNAGLELWL